MPWICQAFDSRQNSGGNSCVFLPGNIVQCFGVTLTTDKSRQEIFYILIH